MANCPGFSPQNIALGSTTKEIALYEYEHSVLNSLVPNAQFALRFGCDARKTLVKCTTLDEFCITNDIKRIDVLKIDTEGFETEVIRGASNLLQAGAVPFIYLEFNDVQPRENAHGGALAPVAELLQGHGYRFVASYNDYIVSDGEFFNVSNALFALTPSRSSSDHVCAAARGD